MKGKNIAYVLATLSVRMLYAYNPYNPNPSSYDVWEARNNAWQSEQAALHSSVNRDEIGWQKHTQDAWTHQHNAIEMETRMHQNERHRANEQERLRMMQQNQDESSGLFVDGMSASQIIHAMKKKQRRQRDFEDMSPSSGRQCYPVKGLRGKTDIGLRGKTDIRLVDRKKRGK